MSIDQPEFDPSEAEKTVLVTLPKPCVAKDLVGRYHKGRSAKRGENSTIYFDDYYAAPVRLADRILPVWFCDRTVYLKGSGEEARQPPSSRVASRPSRAFRSSTNIAAPIARRPSITRGKPMTLTLAPNSSCWSLRFARIGVAGTRSADPHIPTGLNLIVAFLPAWLIRRPAT